MSKSTKIMISVISCVLAVCIVITAVVSVSKRKEAQPSEQTGVSVSDTQTALTEAQASTETASSAEQATEAAETTTAYSSANDVLSQQILGKWMDSANMSGFEFKQGGSVTVTYVNLTVPVINFPINGSADGTYTLSGNDLTVKFSIYTKTITNEYTAYVENNTLTLVNKEDSETSTYERSSDSTAETTQAAATSSSSASSGGIYGTWQNSDSTIKYTFNETGVVNLEFSSATVLNQKFTGSANGVFIVDSNKLTIQYSVLSQQITEEYTFSISDNSMSLVDSNNQTTIFIRSSSESSSSSLIGKWSDSSGMSGYEFKENGEVEVTYVNFTVPVVNMPINGSYTGSYTISGNTVTINVSIYSKSITNSYTYSVSGNTLTLTDTSDSSKISTYTKQ